MTRTATTLVIVAALALAACGEPAGDPGGTMPPSTTAPDDGSTQPAASLAGTDWVVVSFGLDGADDPAIPGRVPTIQFDDDGISAGGSTGCNTWFGAVTYSPGDGIAFGDLAWTEMACMDEGVMEQEQRFAEALARIDRYALSGENLVLEDADGSVVVRLIAPDPAPDLPLGGDWRLTSFVDGETVSSVLSGTEITLTIDPAAGTLSGNAGCNGYTGSLTAEPAPGGRSATLSIGPLATTLMACEPDVMDQEVRYHQVLGAAVEMAVLDGYLVITTDDDRQLLFEAAGG